MVNFTNTLALALATVSMTSALQIRFRRFHHEDCQQRYHIRKDTHLDDGHCKDFTKNELPFNSFRIHAEDDKEDISKKFCRATVFHEHSCKGDGFTYGDMAAYEDRCANVGFDAKSVRITCEERPQSELTSTLPPLPTIMSVPDDEVETITMVPKKQRHRVCYWDNELPSDQQGFDQATQTITMVPAAASSSSPSSPITWLPNDQEGEDDD